MDDVKRDGCPWGCAESDPLDNLIFCGPLRTIEGIFGDDSSPLDTTAPFCGIGLTADCPDIPGETRRNVIACAAYRSIRARGWEKGLGVHEALARQLWLRMRTRASSGQLLRHRTAGARVHSPVARAVSPDLEPARVRPQRSAHRERGPRGQIGPSRKGSASSALTCRASHPRGRVATWWPKEHGLAPLGAPPGRHPPREVASSAEASTAEGDALEMTAHPLAAQLSQMCGVVTHTGRQTRFVRQRLTTTPAKWPEQVQTR